VAQKKRRVPIGCLLFLLFTIVPLIETGLVILMGDLIGFWPTFASVILTAALGAWLGKREGLRVYREWRKALSEMRMPEEGITSGLLVLVGAVLLVAPGVLTDITGILLLIPPTRRFLAKKIQAALQKRIQDGRVQVMTYGFGESFGGRGEGVIDVEGEEVDVASARPRLRREQT
jgi:UPF0716 protein FxsA